jgi:hypothetical protein
MSQPTRWPFAAASGIYLALIAKNHFSLSPEAAEHSRTDFVSGFLLRFAPLAFPSVFFVLDSLPRFVMLLDFDCSDPLGGCACDCSSGCANAIVFSDSLCF